MSILLSALAVVLAGLVALAVAGSLAKARLRRRLPPAGRLVDLGGYRLHLDSFPI